MQRAINVEAKAGLKTSTIVWNLDVYCFKDQRPFYNTSLKMQIQETTVKEPCTKESRTKKIKLANSKTSVPPHSNELVKLNYKEKKKEYWKKKQD